MMNVLMNPDLYDPEYVQLIKRWENLQLEYFGFKKDEEGNWIENELYRGDYLLGSPQKEKKAKVLII